MFLIEIHPVFVKKFDAGGTTEVLSHYIGYINGVAEKVAAAGLKNLFINSSRLAMMDEMFTVLKALQISLS